MLLAAMNYLAQMAPWEDDPAPKKQPSPMNFSDLQQGFKQFNDGGVDNTMRNGLLVILGVVIVLIIIFNIRQRMLKKGPLDSQRLLEKELMKLALFPFGLKWMLKWVARDNQVAVSTLLISPQAYSTCVAKWRDGATFAPVRRWGGQRLSVLEKQIFS